MKERKFTDSDGDSVRVEVDALCGRMVVEFSGCVHAGTAREAAQWVLDNVPAEADDACEGRR